MDRHIHEPHRGDQVCTELPHVGGLRVAHGPFTAFTHAGPIEQRRQANEAAADDAARRWGKAKSAEPTHPYLKKKGISPNGLRQDDDILLVPVRDGEGKLHALQTIPPSGDPKLFGKGSATAGHYFTIGNLATTPAICLAEGYATAARIHEMTGCACIVTFSAHNLVSVIDTIEMKKKLMSTPMTSIGAARTKKLTSDV